jgi:hypothetical protein
MLYGTDSVVVFYSTFNSSDSYTRLGRVGEPASLPAMFGSCSPRTSF